MYLVRFDRYPNLIGKKLIADVKPSPGKGAAERQKADKPVGIIAIPVFSRIRTITVDIGDL